MVDSSLGSSISETRISVLFANRRTSIWKLCLWGCTGWNVIIEYIYSSLNVVHKTYIQSVFLFIYLIVIYEAVSSQQKLVNFYRTRWTFYLWTLYLLTNINLIYQETWAAGGTVFASDKQSISLRLFYHRYIRILSKIKYLEIIVCGINSAIL